jgi:hypothetical protein
MSLKLKRHYKLLVLLVLITAALTVGLGDRRISAYTVQGVAYEQALAGFVDSMAQRSTYLSSTAWLAGLASLSR